MADDAIIGHSPLVYLHVRKGALAKVVLDTLSRAGWHITSDLDARPDLLIVDAWGNHSQVSDDTVPTLAVAAAGAVLSGYDATIDPKTDPAELVALFSMWRPSEGLGKLKDVAAMFGRDAIVPIATGLVAELRAAITALDAGRNDGAHRVAGLAGTLGFTAASAGWEAVSCGETDQAPAARREARLAIAAITRWLETGGE